MGEFALIEAIRQRADTTGTGVALGIGDDAALLNVPAGCALVATTDTLIEGVHFPPDTTPADLGHKCLAVNLSDLAAMGAQPHWALLSLTVPAGDEAWLGSFLDGFVALAAEHDTSLVGGDTCHGSAVAVTVTALGSVEEELALRRSGARAGDLVVVSGTLGGAGLALDQLRSGRRPETVLRRRLLRPQPRVKLGRMLAGKATACIDLSDGLLADLRHVAAASGCGAVLELSELPGEEALISCSPEQRWNFQLGAGDDYELCFAWPAERLEELSGIERASGVALTVVGRMQPGSGVRCRTPEGEEFSPSFEGYEHFHE